MGNKRKFADHLLTTDVEELPQSAVCNADYLANREAVSRWLQTISVCLGAASPSEMLREHKRRVSLGLPSGIAAVVVREYLIFIGRAPTPPLRKPGEGARICDEFGHLRTGSTEVLS